VPFLSFDSQCFYRQWCTSLAQLRVDTVLECPSAAGIQSAVRSGLGVALLNGLHVTADMEVVDDLFPDPPGITYVARTHLKRRNPAAAALIQEIGQEVQTAFDLRTRA